MFECVLMSLAVAVPDLTILYWVCAIVGGSLLAMSMLGAADGHADVEFDADVSFDADADLAVDGSVEAGDVGDGDTLSEVEGASLLATWLSIRFLVYFVAVFGLVGLVFTYLSDLGRAVTFGAAAGGGLVIGQAVHQLFRKLKQASGNSATTVADYVDKAGRVSVAIVHPNKGEVSIRIRSGTRYIPAVAKNPDTNFPIGAEVVVVGYLGGVAEVVSREEFEFINDKRIGGEL